MAQVVSNQRYTVESSTQLTRPEVSTLLRSDANTDQTFITDYDNSRRVKQIHLPHSGPQDYTITCCDNNEVKNSPMPTVVKKRHEDKILDPITSFISPSGEFYVQSNKVNISSFGKVKVDPQTSIPQSINSIRQYREAIDELK